MTDQEKRAKTIEGLKELRSHFRAMAGISSSRQGRANHIESARTIEDAIAVLKDFEHISFEGTSLNREDYVNIGDIIDCLSGLAWEKDAAFHVVGLIEWAMGKRALSRDTLLKVQEPRVMCAAEVAACSKGTVLWVEEAQGVVWNLFPLEIEISSTHPDTGTDYLFFITYHDIRKFECSEYNQTWRCWTSRPTDAQREATPWG